MDFCSQRPTRPANPIANGWKTAATLNCSFAKHCGFTGAWHQASSVPSLRIFRKQECERSRRFTKKSTPTGPITHSLSASAKILEFHRARQVTGLDGFTSAAMPAITVTAEVFDRSSGVMPIALPGETVSHAGTIPTCEAGAGSTVLGVVSNRSDDEESWVPAFAGMTTGNVVDCNL